MTGASLIAGNHRGEVRKVGLVVRSEEIVAVLGPNGSGKSTLLKTAMGLAHVRNGVIRIDERDITLLPTYRRAALGLGYVPQVDNVFLDLSVVENLRMGGYLRPDTVATATMEEVFTLLPPLAARRRTRAGALSGGERRLLAIGTCLMMQPSILLLDEPSSDLSSGMADLVFERIQRIHVEYGIPILLVEQNVERALTATDRAYVLVAGRRALSAPTAELTQASLTAIFLEGTADAGACLT
jgi:ABC-type branched-subunit amino acid transport system ATPase component